MIGIDAKIERVRILFEQGLFLDYSYTSYGRAFVNEKEGGNVPEVLISGTSEYKEVLLDDTLDCSSFFVVDPVYSVDRQMITSKVGIYFSCDLSTVYPTVNERALEYLHRDVMAILELESFKVVGVVSGSDSFSDFDKTKIGDNMQPYYLCRFDCEVEWMHGECVKIPNDARITEGGYFRTTESGTLRITE